MKSEVTTLLLYYVLLLCINMVDCVEQSLFFCRTRENKCTPSLHWLVQM